MEHLLEATREPTRAAQTAVKVEIGLGDRSLKTDTADTRSGDDSSNSVSLKDRRASHNAVEKRRREVISAGIRDVSEVLVANGALPSDHKLNKADILRKGVEYIEKLSAANSELTAAVKDANSFQAEELRALAQELTELCGENEELKMRLAELHD